MNLPFLNASFHKLPLGMLRYEYERAGINSSSLQYDSQSAQKGREPLQIFMAIIIITSFKLIDDEWISYND